MALVTYQMILEINQLLKEKDFNYSVHLKDICGGQSMQIKSIEDKESTDLQKEHVKTVVEEYFRQKGCTMEFSEDGMKFWCRHQ